MCVTFFQNVSFMKNLEKLYVNYDCGINQKGIQGLNLTILKCHGNGEIKDVTFMKNLKKLGIHGPFCGIDQKGIKGLNLSKLDARYNKKIENDRNRFPISVIFQKNNTLCVLLFFKMFLL